MEKWLPSGTGEAVALSWAIKPLEKVLLARGCLLSHHCGVSWGSSVLVGLAMSVPAAVAEFRWWQQIWGDLSPWQRSKVALSSHAKGGGSPVLGLGTQVWPAGLPANIQVCIGVGVGNSLCTPKVGGRSKKGSQKVS